MSGPRSITGLALLCALIACAVGATSASAEQKAYICTSLAPTKEFKDDHCLTKVKPPEAIRGHVLLEKEIEILGSNEKTTGETKAASSWSIKGTLVGIASWIQCATVTLTGRIGNIFSPASASGTVTIQSKGCTVAQPAGKGCVVTGGEFTTKELALTTVGQAAGSLKISPVEGTELAKIPISGCAGNIPPAGSYALTGSLTNSVSQPTLNANEIKTTEENTLKWGSNKAGAEWSLTVSDKTGEVLAFT